MDTPEQPHDDDLATEERWNRLRGETIAERMFRNEMSRLTPKCRAGDGPAIAEAVYRCRVHKQPPPDWLADAVAKLADRRMPDQERRLRHVFATHRERWEAVVELRECSDALKACSIELRNDDRGKTLEKCFAAVSEALANTDAAGSAETIKASYYLIQHAGGEDATLDSYRLAIRQRG